MLKKWGDVDGAGCCVGCYDKYCGLFRIAGIDITVELIRWWVVWLFLLDGYMMRVKVVRFCVLHSDWRYYMCWYDI